MQSSLSFVGQPCLHFNSDDEFSSPDDASAFEFSCEDEEAWSTINAVNVLPATEVTSNEIFELTDQLVGCCSNEPQNVVLLTMHSQCSHGFIQVVMPVELSTGTQCSTVEAYRVLVSED